MRGMGFETSNGNSPEAGRLLSEVEPEQVSWLWPGRFPLGKVSLIDGDPGCGKSAMTTDLAARVSVGRTWPDGAECEAAGAVICSAEDGEGDTIRPRLDAAGGDPERVVVLSTTPDPEGNDRMLELPIDLPIMRRAIERVSARLLILDPLMAFLPGTVDSHKDQDIRRAIAPLAKLAEDTGAAIVVVRHLNKAGGGNPLYRGGGSIGIVGAARSALLVAKHPEDESRRVLAPMKSNLATPAPSLTFTLEEAANGSVRVEWRGSSPLDASALLSAPADDEDRREQMALRDAVGELMEQNGGQYEASPQALWEALADRDAEGLPDRPDELSKILKKIARSGGTLRVSRSRKRDGETVIRTIKLSVNTNPTTHNGVHGGNGGNGVHKEGESEESVNTVNTVYGVNGDSSPGDGVHSAESDSEKTAQVQRLIRQGMEPEVARAEVLQGGIEM